VRNFKDCTLNQDSTNYSPWAKARLLPVYFVFYLSVPFSLGVVLGYLSAQFSLGEGLGWFIFSFGGTGV
jgi:hypothetical protein